MQHRAQAGRDPPAGAAASADMAACARGRNSSQVRARRQHHRPRAAEPRLPGTPPRSTQHAAVASRTRGRARPAALYLLRRLRSLPLRCHQPTIPPPQQPGSRKAIRVSPTPTAKVMLVAGRRERWYGSASWGRTADVCSEAVSAVCLPPHAGQTPWCWQGMGSVRTCGRVSAGPCRPDWRWRGDGSNARAAARRGEKRCCGHSAHCGTANELLSHVPAGCVHELLSRRAGKHPADS